MQAQEDDEHGCAEEGRWTPMSLLRLSYDLAASSYGRKQRSNS